MARVPAEREFVGISGQVLPRNMMPSSNDGAFEQRKEGFSGIGRSPRTILVLALVLHVALGVMLVLLFGWWTLLLVLIFPRLVSCALGSYLFYAQHNFPGVIFGDKNGWAFEKAALQ